MIEIKAPSGVVTALFTFFVEIIVSAVILGYILKRTISLWGLQQIENGNSIFFGQSRKSFPKKASILFFSAQAIFVVLMFYAETGINGREGYIYERKRSLKLGGESWLRTDIFRNASRTLLFTHESGIERRIFGSATKCTNSNNFGSGKLELILRQLHVEQVGKCKRITTSNFTTCVAGKMTCDSLKKVRLLVSSDIQISDLHCEVNINWNSLGTTVSEFFLDGKKNFVNKISFGKHICSGKSYDIEKYENIQGNNLIPRYMWIAERQYQKRWEYVLWHQPAVQNRFFVEYALESDSRVKRAVLAAVMRGVTGGNEIFDEDFIDVFYSQVLWVYESVVGNITVTAFSDDQFKMLDSQAEFRTTSNPITTVSFSRVAPLLAFTFGLILFGILQIIYRSSITKKYYSINLFSIDWLAYIVHEKFNSDTSSAASFPGISFTKSGLNNSDTVRSESLQLKFTNTK